MENVNAGRPPSDADEPAAAAPSMEAVTVDAEDERVVPEALARLVDTARFTLRVMEINAIYPPEVAVTAMEQTTGVLHRLGCHIDLYVGDFSTAGGQAMGRARDLLRQVCLELSAARTHLAIDSESSPVTTAQPVGV